MKNRTLKITLTAQAERLDLAILKSLENEGIKLSRNQLKSAFQNQWIRLLSAPPGLHVKPSLELPLGSHEIELEPNVLALGEKPLAATAPSDFQLPVIYEDENLLILNKPSGVPSLPLSPQETETAVNFALRHAPQVIDVGRIGLEPGLLHRLDTETSGILVFAKTEETYQQISASWKTSKVRKTYRAIACTERGADQPFSPFRIDFPMAHDRDSSKRMLAFPQGIRSGDLKKLRGKPLPAITSIVKAEQIKLSIVAEPNRSRPASLNASRETGGTPTKLFYDLEIEIETGVMHQIRCHLSTLGWPILGDKIYHGDPSSRLWLHAWKISLPLSANTQLLLESQLPSDWPS